LANRTAASAQIPLLIALSSLGTVLAPLNSTMVAVALPDIREEFALSHFAVAWLVSGYLITMAVVQPLGGRLGDQIGRERVYRGGLIVFLVLALITPFSPNFATLVVLRVAQAAAGAALMPNGAAMLRAYAPPDKLGRLNGINGGIISFAAAVGPLIGAATLAVGSWRWLFPISVPLILLALYLLQRLAARDSERIPRAPFDPVGMALFVGVLVALTLQLGSLRGTDGGVEAALRWSLLGAAVVLFAWRQRVTRSPAAEWRLFRVRSFSASTAYILLTNLTMYTTLLMLPFFVREVQGRGTELSGLLLGAMSILIAVTAPVGGRISDVWGRRPTAEAGAICMLVASVGLLAGLSPDVHPGYLAACLALLGFGVGLGVGPAQTAAVESAPRALAGSAAGTSSMMRYVGSIVGAGLLAGVLTDQGATPELWTFRVVIVAVITTAALAALAAVFIHRFAEPEPVPVDRDAPTEVAADPRPLSS
jgi:EmrB/QacA subfamily drug resistance transporter